MLQCQDIEKSNDIWKSNLLRWSTRCVKMVKVVWSGSWLAKVELNLNFTSIWWNVSASHNAYSKSSLSAEDCAKNFPH